VEDGTNDNWLRKLEDIILNPSLDNDEKVQEFITNYAKSLIESEFKRLRDAGVLSSEKIELGRVLIKFPQIGSPIVEFNNEVTLEGQARTIPGASFNKIGQQVTIQDIREIIKVYPPMSEGKIVPFIYIHYLGNGYLIISNFKPIKNAESATDPNFTANDALTAIYQMMMHEEIIRQSANLQLLRRIGLWSVPSLILYPMNKIIEQLATHDDEGARRTLISYCSHDFIRNLSNKWWDIEAFKKRSELIEDAVGSHESGKYRLSIHALLPHIEGIISDYVYSKLGDSIPFRQESKTKKFQDLLLNKELSLYTFNAVVESTIDFILTGPPFRTFDNWSVKLDDLFPNRHVVEHGRYDDSIFTEENSIKVFLLLDTIHYVISRSSPDTKS
jgi:hypothetical protein